MNWQPIESAPFDLDEATGFRWLGNCLLGRHDEYGWVSWVGCMDADMWLEHGSDRTRSRCETPSHWMPLPPPPAQEPPR